MVINIELHSPGGEAAPWLPRGAGGAAGTEAGQPGGGHAGAGAQGAYNKEPGEEGGQETRLSLASTCYPVRRAAWSLGCLSLASPAQALAAPGVHPSQPPWHRLPCGDPPSSSLHPAQGPALPSTS